MEITNVVPQDMKAPQREEAAKKEQPLKMTPRLIIGLSVILLLIGANLFLGLHKTEETPRRPTGVPSPKLPAATTNTSPAANEVSGFSNNLQFQEFEKKLQDLQNANETVDLTENALGFPVVEMHIEYTSP